MQLNSHGIINTIVETMTMHLALDMVNLYFMLILTIV